MTSEQHHLTIAASCERSGDHEGATYHRKLAAELAAPRTA